MYRTEMADFYGGVFKQECKGREEARAMQGVRV